MAYVQLVIVLALIEFAVFCYAVGQARTRYSVPAPATSGHEAFERCFRAHMNTLEQLVVFLPSIWLFAHYINAWIAVALGALFIIGRALYFRGYVQSAQTRHAAVPAEELLGAAQVLDLQPAVSPGERRRSDGAPDTVVDGVAEHGRDAERDARERRPQRAARVDRGQRSDGEEQRVPGQERRHHQPRLGEDHREQDRIDPQVITGQQLDQVSVEMQHEIDEPRQHGAGGYR